MFDVGSARLGAGIVLKSLLFAPAVALALGLSSAANAAYITIGTASGAPGTTVEVPVYIQGDGVVTGTDMAIVFSPESLSLPVANGIIPGAARDGDCARVAGDRISGIVFPVPNRLATVCVIPFTIKSTANPGVVPVIAVDHSCAGPQGQTVSCG